MWVKARWTACILLPAREPVVFSAVLRHSDSCLLYLNVCQWALWLSLRQFTFSGQGISQEMRLLSDHFSVCLCDSRVAHFVPWKCAGYKEVMSEFCTFWFERPYAVQTEKDITSISYLTKEHSARSAQIMMHFVFACCTHTPTHTWHQRILWPLTHAMKQAFPLDMICCPVKWQLNMM